MPAWVDLSFLAPFGFAKANAAGIFEIPFLDRMGFVFLICVVGMALISLLENRRGVKANGLEIDRKMFALDPAFAAGALIVGGIIAAFYTIFGKLLGIRKISFSTEALVRGRSCDSICAGLRMCFEFKLKIWYQTKVGAAYV